MQKTKQMVCLAAILGLMVSGCMGVHRQQPDQPRTMYSSSDATALAYSDPDAASPFDDNPWRWLGFILHPLGVGLDYAINRPIYKLSSTSPGISGYTKEDEQHDAQRTTLTKKIQ